jgi:hypothetical protein
MTKRKKSNTKTAKPRAKRLTKEQLDERKRQNIETLGSIFQMDARAIAALCPKRVKEERRPTIAERRASEAMQRAFAIAKLKELDPTWVPTRTLYDIEREQS